MMHNRSLISLLFLLINATTCNTTPDSVVDIPVNFRPPQSGAMKNSNFGVFNSSYMESLNSTYIRVFSENIVVQCITTMDGAKDVREKLRSSRMIGVDCEGANLSRHTHDSID